MGDTVDRFIAATVEYEITCRLAAYTKTYPDASYEELCKHLEEFMETNKRTNAIAKADCDIQMQNLNAVDSVYNVIKDNIQEVVNDFLYPK